jgi:hypothetical protein
MSSERSVFQSENPLHLAFWFGDVDPRPGALFRIGFGLTILHDLANMAGNLRGFLTDEGMLPRGVQAERVPWSVFEWVGSRGAVSAVFAAGVAAVVLFTIGYRTRATAALSWFFLTSLHTRNLYVTDGGDDLVRYLLFLSIFADLGGAFSVDTWLGRRVSRPVPAFGLRFLQLHIGLLYFVAARLKFRAGWLTHNVIYECLQLTGFVRPPGHMLLAAPSLCHALGALTVALEWSFVFLAFSPFRAGVSRGLAIFAGLATQVGILVTMRVGVFTETMIAAMLLFVLPEWLDRLDGWKAARPGQGTSPSIRPATPLEARNVPPLRAVAVAFLAFQFISLAWGPFIARRFPAPAWVSAERRLLWLDQPFGLFDVVYDVPTWEASGVTKAGRPVDVLAVAVPELVPKIAWSFSRWYKFTFKERERPFRFAELSAYFCRAFEDRAGEPLRELTLVETLTPPIHAGAATGGPARRRARWHHDCEAP